MRKRFVSFLFYTCMCMLTWSQNVNSSFVDMGVKADNGDVLYWANGDFALMTDGSCCILETSRIGTSLGWGDITGKAAGTDLALYGGMNPLKQISGNEKYDITTAKLGKEYRLPTYNEIQRLVDNTTKRVETKIIDLPEIDFRGVPTWIYGQWMWEMTIITNKGNAGYWNSLKFDGPIVNVVSNKNGTPQVLYNGPYTYENGILSFGGTKLFADENSKILKSTENDGYFRKISNQSEASEMVYYVLTSKINGNKLYFPLHSAKQYGTAKDGKYTIVWDNPNVEQIGYWTGSVYNEDTKGAILLLMNNQGYGPQISHRYERYRIRPVKNDIGSGARLAEEKRIAEQKMVEQKARQEELEKHKREQERIKLIQLKKEAYANNSIIKALSLFDDEDLCKGLFDCKMYIEWTRNRRAIQNVALYLYANQNTRDFYKKFSECVNSGENKEEHNRFIEEKYNETLPNIIKCLNDFSIVNAEGDTCNFKIVSTSKNYLTFQVDGENSRFNLYPKRNNRGVNADMKFDIFPFLQAEYNVGEAMYHCVFSLPVSSSFSIVSDNINTEVVVVEENGFRQLQAGISDDKTIKESVSILSKRMDEIRSNIEEKNRQNEARKALFEEERKRMEQRDKEYKEATEKRKRLMKQVDKDDYQKLLESRKRYNR